MLISVVRDRIRRIDIAGTEPPDQLVAAWPRGAAVGGANEIIIDDLDVPKAMPSRFIDQLVLTTMAVEV